MQSVVAIGGDGVSERDLVARDARFRAAIEPLVKVAYRVLHRLGVRSGEIDDAVQAVLVAADRRFDDIATRADLKAYVCAACVNVARDVGRRRSRRAAEASPLDDLEQDPASEQAGPADLLERKQTLALVHGILERMLPERREVFVLYELEELTGREIAEHLGVPAGTVASRLRKARDDFRAAFELAHADDPNEGRGT